ncbi:hypothetical protein C8Q74DRAFT_245104 [Fomes fomentarius]|nr:hypothetical protein C8Q74DRAFT_245104 [Fomes fomentarius]
MDPTQVVHWTRVTTAQYSIIAECALTIYEWVISMDREVQYFWSRKTRFAALLYYINRYSGVACSLFSILQIHQWWGLNPESCKLLLGFEIATCLLVIYAVVIFSALRVYFACNRNKVIVALIIATLLIHPVITTYLFTRTSITMIPSPMGEICTYTPVISAQTFGK